MPVASGTPQRLVVIVEDNPTVSMLLDRTLQGAQFDTRVFVTGGEVRAWLERGNTCALALLDIMLPDTDGVDLLRLFQQERSETPVIMMTGHATVERAVECMKAGAYDFLTKPIDVTRLAVTLEHALELHQLKTKVIRFEAEQKRRMGFGVMIGHSPPMQALYSIIENVAQSKAPVLITGETGAGKELVALAIHESSERSQGPFVPVNCGALPRELIESELFGHEKGAYTGADRMLVGKCELADQGTLFLDEVCEIPLDLQVKFLRFLQNQEVQRLGSAETKRVNVRVIAATNREPRTEVREGRMREDLYYRLNVIPITVPALRERGDDIPLLVEAFVEEFNHAYGKEIEDVDAEAMGYLISYRWPGNVRELRNVVERIVVMHHDKVIHADAVPEEVRSAARLDGAAPPSQKTRRMSREIKPLAEMEREAIEKAYALCEGNVALMAERLEMSVATIYRRLKEYERLSAAGEDRTAST